MLGRWGADFSIRGKSGSTAKDISNRNGRRIKSDYPSQLFNLYWLDPLSACIF